MSKEQKQLCWPLLFVFGIPLCALLLVVIFTGSTRLEASGTQERRERQERAVAEALARFQHPRTAEGVVAHSRRQLPSGPQREAYDRAVEASKALTEQAKAVGESGQSASERQLAVRDLGRGMVEALEDAQRGLQGEARLVFALEQRVVTRLVGHMNDYVEAVAAADLELDAFMNGGRGLVDSEILLASADAVIDQALRWKAECDGLRAFYRREGRALGISSGQVDFLLQSMEATGEMRSLVGGARIRVKHARLNYQQTALLTREGKGASLAPETGFFRFRRQKAGREFDLLAAQMNALDQEADQLLTKVGGW